MGKPNVMSSMSFLSMDFAELRSSDHRATWAIRGSGGFPTPGSFLGIAGAAGLSRATQERSVPVLVPIELIPNNFVFESTDVLQPAVLQHIKLLITRGWVLSVHFARARLSA